MLRFRSPSLHNSISSYCGERYQMTTKTLIRSKLLASLCLLSAFGGTTLAQEPTDKSVRPTIRVTGDAIVIAKPDQAEINIGVVTQAQTGKAEAIASALGLKIQRVLHVEEGGSIIRPVEYGDTMGAMRAAATAPTPIESGSIDVRATVTLTVEVVQ